jgi:glycosyltransferase involved in cell wall biosynthesis
VAGTTGGGLRVAATVEQLWQPAPGGSGTYIRELMSALPSAPGVAGVLGVAARHAGPPPDGALPVPVVRSVLPRPALYEAWNRVPVPVLPRAARRADVLHATTWAVPRTRTPLVVTVHDLAFLRSPEHFTPRGNAFFRRAWRRVLAEADVVVVPSRTTALDCAEHGLDESRTVVVPHGVRLPPLPAAQARAVRGRLGLDRPYLLWCGTLEPRKNLGTLLEAFDRVARQVPDLDLAVIGPAGWGGEAARLRDRLSGTAVDRVRLLGAVSWPELHAAYAGARAFAFPSTWEGFGLPVLESMAHGVPVITSARTSMAEITGDAALLVDALDVEAWVDGLLRLTGPEHDAFARAALDRASAFTWEAAAAGTVAAYRQAVAR